ncbi:MAG TPA: YkvA family protein [Gaiellaceae bacterium]
MSWTLWTLVLLGGLALVWVAAVLFLFFAGRRTQARALAGFIPDCIVLVGRLLHDPRVPRRRKLLLVATAGYLALPFDLVPDFIPVVGQLDDAIIVALVLRSFLRGGEEQLLREHWPGPESSLELILRLINRNVSTSPEKA